MTRNRIITLTATVLALASPWARAWDTNEWEFLETIQRANLRFFQEQKRGPYQLINDTAPYDSTTLSTPAYSSVAGVGFELTAVCLGHYLGWISFSNAYEQVLLQVKAFNNRLSEDPEVFARVNGWTYHTYWMDGPDAGKRYFLPDGLSLLDHSLFMGGCIFAAEYFKGTEAGELAHRLYEETQWNGRPDADYTGFGYSENLLSIVEAAEAPQFKKGAAARGMWNSLVVPWPRTLQLYFWQYPHCWVDFRFRTDDHGFNHVDVARDSILYMRQRAIDLHQQDPATYSMIGSNVWGWTAASSSEGYRQMAPWGLWLGGQFYDEEHASDSGSVTPFGLPPCMAYAPTETMAAMKHLFEQYYINGWDPGQGELPVWSPVYGFLNCFNDGAPWVSAKPNHFHGVNAAIDYGPNVLMVENYLRGTTWRYFMQNPSIEAGMNTLGFTPPAWRTFAAFSNQVNEFGGALGSWDNDGTPVTIGYAPVAETNGWVRDYAVRITADNRDEGGWIDLNGCDQRRQAVLSFWVKGQSGEERVEVGLKDMPGRENKVDLLDFTGGTLPTNWTEVKIPLEAFTLTGSAAQDIWLGRLALVSFAFLNDAGGELDIDYLAFTPDTMAPRVPGDGFGVAQAGAYPRVRWDPAALDRDVVGLHIWRRENGTSAFERVTDTLVPAYAGVFEDTSFETPYGAEVRYAIQAYDNAAPQLSSVFTPEKIVYGGRLDLDWNNGRNPNVLGGSNDEYFGPAGDQALAFEEAVLPNGEPGWARRSHVASPGGGHTIDLTDSDLGDYWALGFSIRGAVGGESLWVGLRDRDDLEVLVDLAAYLGGDPLGTQWQRVVLPFSDFPQLDKTAIRNFSLTYGAPGTVYLADIGFLAGQRPLLGDDYKTECEDYTSQSGRPEPDLKDGASGGEVLGNGWGLDGGDFAEYTVRLSRPLTEPALAVRYACNAGNGRVLEVFHDGQFVSTLTLTNTAGWGEQSNHFSWASAGLPGSLPGPHVLRIAANGVDEPVNLDCFRLVDGGSHYREAEDFDAQVGSAGPDPKAGASGGFVLGSSWGQAAGAEALYQQVNAGSPTGAWFHLWYASNTMSGRVVDVHLDDAWVARFPCAPTGGWGERASHFDRASAFVGLLGPGPHHVRLSAPGEGEAINLDAFYVGPVGPDGLAADLDGDGLSDRQEVVAGTAAAEHDSDGDGLGDGDEWLARGLYGQVSDPTRADTDGDGHNDLEESVAGTDPGDDASVFAFSGMWAATGPALRLNWQIVSNRVYRLYTTSGLRPGDAAFVEIPDPGQVVLEGDTATYTEQETSSNRFYRLDVKRGP